MDWSVVRSDRGFEQSRQWGSNPAYKQVYIAQLAPGSAPAAPNLRSQFRENTIVRPLYQLFGAPQAKFFKTNDLFVI